MSSGELSTRASGECAHDTDAVKAANPILRWLSRASSRRTMDIDRASERMMPAEDGAETAVSTRRG
jgi:hypothetical protein